MCKESFKPIHVGHVLLQHTESYMYNNIKYNQICNFLLLGKVIYYTCNTTMWVKTLAIRLISIYILLRRLY